MFIAPFLILSVAIAAAPTPSATPLPREKTALELALEGQKLTEADANALEEKLIQSPDDLTARAELLGYYTSNHKLLMQKPVLVRTAESHMLWFIEKRPADMAIQIFAHINPTISPLAYKKALELWEQHTTSEQQNSSILFNAANFFAPHDPERAENLLLRIQQIDPKFDRLESALAQVRSFKKDSASVTQVAALLTQAHQAGAQSPLSAVRILETGLKSLEKRPKEIVGALAEFLVKTKDYRKSRTLAQELLLMKEPIGNGPSYDAIHHAHHILGEIALAQGNPKMAASELLRAGEVGATATLASYGPRVELAIKLIDLKQRAAVVMYLKSCRKFWEIHRPEIDEWISDLEKGAKPELWGQDKGPSFDAYVRMAKHGNPHAQLQVAYAFREGIGVEKDLKSSFQWYQKLAASKPQTDLETIAVIHGCVGMGYAYYGGVGTTKDPGLAFKWYSRAAQLGNRAPASFDEDPQWRTMLDTMVHVRRFLSFAYANGFGTEKNAQQAKYWGDLASQLSPDTESQPTAP